MKREIAAVLMQMLAPILITGIFIAIVLFIVRDETHWTRWQDLCRGNGGRVVQISAGQQDVYGCYQGSTPLRSYVRG